MFRTTDHSLRSTTKRVQELPQSGRGRERHVAARVCIDGFIGHEQTQTTIAAKRSLPDEESTA